MRNTHFFISGMPRAGSTLLCNLLAQNPECRVTPTSGLFEVILGIRNNWERITEFKAAPNEEARIRVMRGALDSYFLDVGKVVFDKSRGWLSHIELLDTLLLTPAKFLVTVRGVDEILSSLELLWRKNAAIRPISQETANYAQWQTIEGRCEVWCASNQLVGISYNRIKDAIVRGFRDRMLFVDFDRLTRTPDSCLKEIYGFLGIPEFSHDPKNVKQVTHEDDIFHGILGLHDIRPEIRPLPLRADTVLGPRLASKYRGKYPWSEV